MSQFKRLDRGFYMERESAQLFANRDV